MDQEVIDRLTKVRDRLRKLANEHQEPAGQEAFLIMQSYHDIAKVVGYPADAF